jgi:hypothetical protein
MKDAKTGMKRQNNTNFKMSGKYAVFVVAKTVATSSRQNVPGVADSNHVQIVTV